MSPGVPNPQQKPSEWRHSVRYLLIALVLHGIVLFYPISMTLRQLETPQPEVVQVRLQESLSAAKRVPATPAEKLPAPTVPHHPKAIQAPQPIIALTPEQARTPATISVPAPVAVPAPLTVPVAAPNNGAPATVSAPQFNAAYLHNPEPKYPSISRRMGEEGKVLLKVRVTPDGLAAAVSIDKSSGYDRLDESARDTVTRWRFVPAKRGDEAIEATVIVPIVFRLDN